MAKRWNSQRRISGGGVLIDNGTHSVDIARFLLGPIALIQAQFGCQIQKIPVEDTACIYFQSKSRVMGTIDVSWSLNKDLASYINIYGTEGTLLIGWASSQYKLHEKDKWEIFGRGYDKHQAFEKQSKHFIDCIASGKKPIIKAIDGLESVKVIERAYQSSRINKWLKVDKR
jgi:predicted dehydrogenase